MSIDPLERDDESRSRVNIAEPAELRRWMHTLHVSESELRDAIERVGPYAREVRCYLGKDDPGGY